MNTKDPFLDTETSGILDLSKVIRITNIVRLSDEKERTYSVFRLYFENTVFISRKGEKLPYIEIGMKDIPEDCNDMSDYRNKIIKQWKECKGFGTTIHETEEKIITSIESIETS